MYKYEYVTITAYNQGWGPINGASWEVWRHRDIIDARAAQGWRYVGYLPVKQRGTGHIEELELIFEKEVDP